MDFNEKAAKLIIDGVVYYQVVMTLPSELSALALSNRELFGRLLPKSAWSSLDRSIRTEQGYEAAAVSVLHTWNQQLMRHWHVHLLVPGAGPSVEGDRWVEATPPAGSRNDHGFYLVDADKLRSRFRKTLLRRLERARAAGKLKLTGRHAYLQDDDNWTAFINDLESKTWVAYIQPPPTTESKAHHVVNYLTRYLTGGPISDHRIVSANRHERDVLGPRRQASRWPASPSSAHNLDERIHAALERAHPAGAIDEGALLRWLEQFQSRPLHGALSRPVPSDARRNRR